MHVKSSPGTVTLRDHVTTTALSLLLVLISPLPGPGPPPPAAPPRPRPSGSPRGHSSTRCAPCPAWSQCRSGNMFSLVTWPRPVLSRVTDCQLGQPYITSVSCLAQTSNAYSQLDLFHSRFDLTTQHIMKMKRHIFMYLSVIAESHHTPSLLSVCCSYSFVYTLRRSLVWFGLLLDLSSVLYYILLSSFIHACIIILSFISNKSSSSCNTSKQLY